MGGGRPGQPRHLWVETGHSSQTLREPALPAPVMTSARPGRL